MGRKQTGEVKLTQGKIDISEGKDIRKTGMGRETRVMEQFTRQREDG